MKKTKRLIAVFLAVIMAATCLFCIPSSAVYQKNNHFREMYPELFELEGDGENYPTIIFPGINHSPYYVADEKGQELSDKSGGLLESTLLLLNKDALTSDIIKIIPNLLLSIFLQRDFGLTKKIEYVVYDLMKYMEMSPDGTPVNNLLTKKFLSSVAEFSESDKSFFYSMLPVEPIAEVCGEDNLYLYTFPLFGDPMSCPSDIDNFIEGILKKTGAEKFNIATVSLGGTMLSAYLEEGKNTYKINKIVNMVSLMDGTDIIADFLDRKFNDSDEFVHSEFIPLILGATSGDEGLGHLINILLRFIPKKLFNAIISTAYGALHSTVMINNPEFWAMVPSGRYEQIANSRIKNPILRAKTDRFHNAQVNLKKNLAELSKNGTKVFTICGSDLTYTDGEYAFFGVVASSATANSDGIIPVQSTSLGATAVKKGSTFDDAYLASHDAKYISPLKSVDASTCLFPDRTWFFSSQHHEVGRADVVIRLAALILKGAIDNVNSSDLFPQFNGSRNTRSIVRSNGGFDTLYYVINSPDKFSKEIIDEATLVKDHTVAMLNNTICNQDEADKADKEIDEILIKAGAKEKGKKSFSFSSIPGLEKFDNYLFKIYKGKGFSER